MKRIFMVSATMFVAMVSAQFASVQAQTASMNAAEACISSNAADVEATTDDLSRATDFLLTYVCASELKVLEKEQAAYDKEARAKKLERHCQGQKDGSASSMFCGDNAEYFTSFGDYNWTEDNVITVPSELKSYAAKKLLQLRLKRKAN